MGELYGMKVISETQIKTTMRYHLTPVQRAIIKNFTNNAGEGGNVNWYSHYGDQYAGSLKN